MKMGNVNCKEKRRSSAKKAASYRSVTKARAQHFKTTKDKYLPTGSATNQLCADELPAVNLPDDKAYSKVQFDGDKWSTKESSAYESVRDFKARGIQSFTEVQHVKVKRSTKKSNAKSYETVRCFQSMNPQSIVSDTQYTSTSLDHDNATIHWSRDIDQSSERSNDDLHDNCTLCADKGIGEQASHICFSCSRYGRYFCGKCLQHHNTFKKGHDLKSLSAAVYDKSNNNRSSEQHRMRTKKHNMEHKDRKYLEMPTTVTKRKEIRSKSQNDHADREQISERQKREALNEETSSSVYSLKAFSEPTFRTQTTVNRSQQTLTLPRVSANRAADWIYGAIDWTNKQRENENTKAKSLIRANESHMLFHDTNDNTDQVQNRQHLVIDKQAQYRFQNITEEYCARSNLPPEVKTHFDAKVTEKNQSTKELQLRTNRLGAFSDESVIGQSKSQSRKYEENTAIDDIPNVASLPHKVVKVERTSDDLRHKYRPFIEIYSKENGGLILQNEGKAKIESNEMLRKSKGNVTLDRHNMLQSPQTIFITEESSENIHQHRNLREDKQEGVSQESSETMTQKHIAQTRQSKAMNWTISILQQYTDLYKREWVDAFNALVTADNDTKTEGQACAVLLSVLITMYSISIEKVQVGLATNSLKDLYVSENHRHEVLSKEDNERLRKTITEEAMKSVNNNICRKDRISITKFIIKCSGLCFLMATREPKVCIDTDFERHGQSFDPRKYKPYRNDGTIIDYIVWPALCLEENGEVLKKGIVQVVRETEADEKE